jgi:hypothetical protein
MNAQHSTGCANAAQLFGEREEPETAAVENVIISHERRHLCGL